MSADAILIAEDNEDDEELAVRTLRKAALTDHIIVVRDGQQAVDYLCASGDFACRDPQLVIRVMFLDMKLPKLNGLQVLRKIRSSRLPPIPVVVLSSSDLESDVTAAYAEGANSYVAKPVRFDLYAEAIASIGAYWLRHNLVPTQPHRK